MASDYISHPSKTWDFTAALDLLAAFKPHTPSPARPSQQPEAPRSPSPLKHAHDYDPKTRKPATLGDFDRLFDFLGVPYESTLSHFQRSANSSSSSASDKSTPPSSLPDGPGLEDFLRKGKEVRWTDEVHGSDIAGYGRRSTRTSSFGLRTPPTSLDESDAEDGPPSRNTRSRRRSRARLLATKGATEVESEPEVSIYQLRGRGEEGDDASLPTIKTKLIPSSVTPIQQPKVSHALWVPPLIPIISYSPHKIQPIDTLTREEKRAKLVKKLQKRFNSDSARLIQMKQAHSEGFYDGNISPDGIHVFVDCSNIVIGFINQLKLARGMNIRSPAKGGKISWPALSMILERGRSVARRILVGSHGSPLDSRQPRRPEYMTEAENCGYELNILDRVIKNKDVTPYKKKHGHGNGYATTSGYSSGSDGTYMSRKAVAEQGVDEILHMKLLESLIDTAVPSTIVLASGDAAEAEYSGGFMKNVERALKNGWKVELVAWSAGLSREYQSDAFLKQWKGRFSIILLDDFSEEMFAVYTEKWRGPPAV